MVKKLQWKDEQSLRIIGVLLQAEKIFVGGSDTVIGLFGPLSAQGKKVLDLIKNRSDKPYLVLVASKEKAEKYVDSTRLTEQILVQIEKVMHSCWPGPLTIILPAHPDLLDYMKSKQGTIALRIPDHVGLQKLLAKTDGLFSTSANKSGQPIPESADTIDPAILNQVEYLIVDEQEKKRKPSTIIDATGDTITVVREGAYSVADLEKVIGGKVR